MSDMIMDEGKRIIDSAIGSVFAIRDLQPSVEVYFGNKKCLIDAWQSVSEELGQIHSLLENGSAKLARLKVRDLDMWVMDCLEHKIVPSAAYTPKQRCVSFSKIIAAADTMLRITGTVPVAVLINPGTWVDLGNHAKLAGKEVEAQVKASGLDEINGMKLIMDSTTPLGEFRFSVQAPR